MQAKRTDRGVVLAEGFGDNRVFDVALHDASRAYLG